MAAASDPRPTVHWRWRAALFGQALFVFAIVALSGPGRIDITDGQVRYDVARSLVEHGDSRVRDSRLWFAVLPGRGGERYTVYRFPQSVLGAGAIIIADITGPVDEERRRFFFVLTSAAVAALLAVTYSVWFRSIGLSPLSAILWGSAGIFCTPLWFYATSTFDDILGAGALVLMLVSSFLVGRQKPILGGLMGGLFAGLALNCKQPLAAYVLVALAGVYDPAMGWRTQVGRLSAVLSGFAVGAAAYLGYDYYKFPEGMAAAYRGHEADYVPNYPGHPIANLIHLAISPAAGVFWYFPPLLLACFGFRAWCRHEPLLGASIIVATAVFVSFIAALTIFKGDPAWGPRYLTPVFALLWLFAPAGVPRLGTRLAGLLLVLGFAVQLLALSVDPHRLYFERGLHSAFYYRDPWRYLDPTVSHLVNRPREIVEIAIDNHRAEEFTPAPAPTFGFPVMEEVRENLPDDLMPGRLIIRRYHILNSYRPWWASMTYLANSERPVHLMGTALLLIVICGIGFVFLVVGTRNASNG